ncbi:DUF1156 domain-containing protein [Clostridium sp. FP2]|uniref:anti-phage-associated DUF1156 domain-containing protein n=1 Tax=Clostridium sp. FP2 TaxID=2724481 RepID=UPI0013E90871|nr:anti-phage-associated DUF1156 domain-containing protein [Clostridium sp. FP2]MBZ9623253.1 DUF1156 domain-containing protein [Clostridium sp. FP2]
MSYEKSFIEVQFPVSKISKESYKERKAVQSQTLTGLGKWWGRKPLILVRASIIGLLMPVSTNAKKDREIFLKILSMDEEGLELRKTKSISIKDLLRYSNSSDNQKYFLGENDGKLPEYRKGITKEEKEDIQLKIFRLMSYDEKLKYCVRPEEIEKKLETTWSKINNHLGTNSNSVNGLINELGTRRFGHKPIVGDAFSGGGSIPFEAARIGCNIYSSDLNPLAGLLTWADVNILSKTKDEIDKLKEFQERVYSEVSKKVDELGIETNDEGDFANAYLYCSETVCPECGYKVPLSTSWYVSKSANCVILLVDNKNDGFDLQVIENATKEQVKKAEDMITISHGNIYCPHCNIQTPIAAIRRDLKEKGSEVTYGLRKWNKEEFIPRKDDIFQDRLYCIRYSRQYIDINGKVKIKRYYTAPTSSDLIREETVIQLLKERIVEWQERGYIPSSLIESGEKTDEPIRTRGWAYWHQLFNPRQLILHGLFVEQVMKLANNTSEKVIGILGVNRICDWNSKLCRWGVGEARESMAQTFYNQALNTIFQHGTKALSLLKSNWILDIQDYNFDVEEVCIEVKDARSTNFFADLWITDPPYADAVNYHELTEFFLAWDKKMISDTFENWPTDSRRVLAVRGVGKSFNDSMIEIYKNLANRMNDNGMQIVMFTHSDVKVWAELAMILWSSGLQVTAAWNIATETDASGLKDGNYIKGTVILILRKQSSDETAYLDELYPEIEEEVKYQINSMRELDDKEDPNFSDTDYLLAAYAASLKILTSYKNIEDIDVKYEISKSRGTNEVSPIENIINQAVKIAHDYLIPSDFDSFIWKSLIPEERLYLKGIELEKHNLYQLSSYQQLARGFSVGEYTTMLASTKANTARLKTPKEFAVKNLNDNSNFGSSLIRNILVAIYLGLKEEDTYKGRNWLKTEVTDYPNKRNSIMEILNYLSKAEYIDNMGHWKECAHEAFILKNLVENDTM